MTVVASVPDREELFRENARPSHFVQFFDDDAALADSVARFIGTGLAFGDPAVVITTEAHRTAIMARLEENAIDLERATKTERIVFLDAHETLACFMVGRVPDPKRFRETIGPVLERASRGQPVCVRAFGEMVDILASEGNGDAAIALEELWNELAREHTFALFCAYRMATFANVEDSAVFARVCGTHAHVHPAESFSALDDDARRRQIATLQQRARALESELERRALLEKALREASTQISESETELRDFVENAAEGLHWVGPDGIIKWANAAETAMLGYSLDEYIGKHIREIHADSRSIDDILSRLARGETLHDYEARLRCKDGSIRHVLIHSNVYRRDGEFVHTRCFTRDITLRKRAEEQLKKKTADLEALAQQLEEASRTKDEFLATVSHELRTPLNAIVGWVRMLRAGTLPPEKHDRAIETIERNANAQSQLIDDLLDVSRIVSGKLRLDVSNVDVPLVIDDAIEAVRPATTAKGIVVETHVDRSLAPILGDAGRLEQVIWNLLTNAVKFTPRGGRVAIDVKMRDASIEIAIADSGEGIAPEFLEHVFERFRQADATTTRKHGGLGLGLAIVRHIVELHGGTVRADSAGVGRGATFTVCLPISAASRASSRPSFDMPPAIGSVSVSAMRVADVDLGGLRVLVVDDEPDAREVVGEVLAMANARVETVATVDEALAYVKAHRPDVIVSDISMPGKDGYSLIHSLRARPESEGSCTPAVALTAYARFEDRTRALVAGFNVHVAKPVQPAELLAAVASLKPLLASA